MLDISTNYTLSCANCLSALLADVDGNTVLDGGCHILGALFAVEVIGGLLVDDAGYLVAAVADSDDGVVHDGLDGVGVLLGEGALGLIALVVVVVGLLAYLGLELRLIGGLVGAHAGVAVLLLVVLVEAVADEAPGRVLVLAGGGDGEACVHAEHGAAALHARGSP